MKFIILMLSLFFFSTPSSNAQKETPVKWSFELKKLSDTEFEIFAKANIKKEWTIYSQFTEDNGPVPTAFVVDDKEVKFEEKSTSTTEFDPLFEVNVIKFKEEAIFSYKIKKENAQSCKGYVTFMTCDGAKCLPPTDVEFELKF
jgi:hypothetical protein